MLAPQHVELLKQIRDDLLAAETCLKSKSAGPTLRTHESNRALAALCRTGRMSLCRGMVTNNALWMRTISADTYRY